MTAKSRTLQASIEIGPYLSCDLCRAPALRVLRLSLETANGPVPLLHVCAVCWDRDGAAVRAAGDRFGP